MEADLSNNHGAGNDDLLGGLATGDGPVRADAELDPDESVAVHNPAVLHKEGVIFSLLNGTSPLLGFDVRLQAFDACP